MKIGIYARGLSKKTGGVKEAIENISKAIIDIAKDKDEIYIIHNLKEKYFNSPKKNVKEILLKSSSKIICDYILAPKVINNLKLDVVVFPKNVIPFFVKTKKVLIVHDMIYYLPHLNAYKPLDTFYMKFMIKNSCQRADKIIAISQSTKRDLINILKIKKHQIKVVYWGTDNFFKKLPSEKLKTTKKKYSLNKDFIFYSGSITPRKNIIRLVKAYNLAREKINLDLVITGTVLRKNKEEMRLISQSRGIKLVGFVPKEDLRNLYNLAKIYIYPSLYEGFGLPVLEAQACGCPVICSNTSSLPEVGKDSVYYINPYNEKDIANAIIKLSTNPKLRKQLIKKGYQNIKRFSWKKSAQKILNVCRIIK